MPRFIVQRYCKKQIIQNKKGFFNYLMVSEELKCQILLQFGFPATAEQERAVDTFVRFMAHRGGSPVMILRGSAGTGKTSLSGAMVRALRLLRQKVVLLAPTGRAAKVFSANSGCAAYTIHRRIYREKAFAGVDGQFLLNDNLFADTLFMVDEASMIANAGQGGSMFGSGCLLDDLVSFVYRGQNDRLLLVGDKAQLPPVGEDGSPALCGEAMGRYGLTVYECDLDEVVRHGRRSGILYNATMVRRMMMCGDGLGLPVIRFRGFADIVPMPGDELVESLQDSFYRMGEDETIVISRSNKRANIFNRGIRGQVLGREEELGRGDMLMVVKNNYFWTERERQSAKGDADVLATIPPFLANGDRAKVLRVSNRVDLYGFRFATLLLQFPDYDDYELEATVLLDTLDSESPSLTHEQQERLFRGVEQDCLDIPRKADRLKRIRQDAYFNALQVKFSYAVTCHKAQGGQWSHVYVDQGYMTDDILTPGYLHWLYTAFTRATEKLFLVNWPKAQTE